MTTPEAVARNHSAVRALADRLEREGWTGDARRESAMSDPIQRESIEDALETDRCGTCGATLSTAVIEYCWDDQNTTVAVVVAAIRRALGDLQ
jgi:hypothetical protein